ncbi:hypothetical protein GWK47_033902 [Chionoecetes opilio]|uniref:Uncharacterized protein n=1 Tax=Chionoecetes opilio TaxID=41210 RepID=A0A8J5D051_CHIOP|nr:hypothetical protein GWK47_033902 [Chionoecetes opilio]
MAGGVVVAVLFSLRFISVLDPASAQDCTAADHVVEEGNVQTVYQNKTDKKKVSTSLFVQPGTAFEGVSVEVTQLSNNTKFEAWFPADLCYPNDATWVQLKVGVEAKTPENKTHNFLSFTTTIGNCTKTCTRYPTFYYIKSLSVVAHGSSKWNCTCPTTTCLAPQVSSGSPNISKCMEPPGLSTITTNSTTIPTTPTTITPNTTTIPTTLTTITTTPTTITPNTTTIPTTLTTITPTTITTNPTTITTNPTTSPAAITTTTPAAINASTMMATPTTTVSTKLPSQSHALKITGVPSVLLSPSTVVIVLQVAVAVQVAMMVMVVVALVPWKRRCGATPTHTVSWRRVAPTQASSCRNSESVSENSLYEPFPGPLNTADNRSQVQINLATAS